MKVTVGNNVIEFPDSMSSEEISQKINESGLISQAKGAGALDQSLGTVDLGAEAAKKAKVAAGGAVEGGLRTLGLPLDLIGAVGKMVGVPQPEGGSPSTAAIEGFRGAFPGTQPTSGLERIISRGAQEVGAAAVATPAMRMLGLLRNLPAAKMAAVEGAIAASAGTAAGVAREVTTGAGSAVSPEIADFVGQLIGSFGAAGAMNLVRLARQGKTTVEGTMTKVAGSDPNFEQNLAAGAQLNEEVPGLNLRTSQVTGSPSATALERGMMRKNPAAAEAVAQQERTAPTAIRNYGETKLGVPAGDVTQTQGAVGQGLATERAGVQAGVGKAAEGYAAAESADREFRNRLIQSADRYAVDAETAVQAEAKRISGSLMDRQQAGEAIVGEIVRRKAELHKQADALFAKVDPENIVKLPTDSIRQALSDVTGDIEQSIRGGAMPPVLKNLQQRLGETLNPDAKRLLDRVKDNPEKLAQLQAEMADAGLTGSSDVLFNKLRRWRSDLIEARRDALGGVQPDRQSAFHISRVLDAVDETIEQTARTGSDAAARYREAADFYRSVMQRFEQGTIARVTQRGARGEAIRTPPEDVGRQFLKTSNGTTTAAQDFIRAVGDSTVAARGLRDSAFQDFFTAAMDGPTLNPVRAKAWLDKHADALRQFPEIAAEMTKVTAMAENAGTRTALATKISKDAAAGRTPVEAAGPVAADQLKVAQAAAARKLNDIDRSAAALFVGAEPSQAMKTLLSKGDAAAFRQVVSMTQGDEAALRGLKRGLWDQFIAETAGTSGTATGSPWLSAEKMRNFIDRHGVAFREVYGVDSLKTLATMQRAAELVEKGATPATVDLATRGLDTSTMHLMGAAISKAFGVQIPGFGAWTVSRGVAQRVQTALNSFSREETQSILQGALFDPKVALALIDVTRPATGVQGAVATLKKYVHAEYGYLGRGVAPGSPQK